MKDAVTFEIEGMKEVMAALEQIAVRSTRTAVQRRALREAAIPMRDAARSFAPGDRLNRGIQIGTRIKGEAGNVAYAKAMKETGDKGQAVQASRDARRAAKASGVNPPVVLFMGPSTDEFFAFWTEFGTGFRKRKDGRSTGRMMADPYMRPAFDKEAQPTVARMIPLLWQEIEKSAARARKRAAKSGN